jgi:hypothetical protein
MMKRVELLLIIGQSVRVAVDETQEQFRTQRKGKPLPEDLRRP